jgi:DNA polymerase
MLDEQLSLFSNSSLSGNAASNFDLIPSDRQVPIALGTYPNLEQLTKHCQVCHRCQLGDTRLNAVVSRGNNQSSLMIVGEGPGQNEDETGLPFVGKAGQLLEKILASVGFDTEQDVYICNVVKCRPPQNRVPTTKEMEACVPYLLEQIRLVDPKIILLTGSTAVKGLLGNKTPITKIRGTWIEWQGRLCMPIFHPSYLLRNPSREKGSPKWFMWQDIQAIKAKIELLNR